MQRWPCIDSAPCSSAQHRNFISAVMIVSKCNLLLRVVGSASGIAFQIREFEMHAVGEISTCREVVVFVFCIAALPFAWISTCEEVVVDFVRLRKISSRGEVFADARVATSRDF